MKTFPISSILSSLTIALVLISCNSKSDPVTHSDTVEPQLEEKTISETKMADVDTIISIDSLELDTDVPFKYPCDCSFEHVGLIKVSDSRWEEVQIGKGWDPNRYSCTFVWGEHIYNNLPADTAVIDFRMHLVDLNIDDFELTPEFLQSDLFKQHLIVTSISDEHDLATFWDPNGTGKYPKPKQWVE